MTTTERRIMQLAADQGGFLLRRQALELGMSDKQLQYRVRTGNWTRPGIGLYQLMEMPGDRNRLKAAVRLLPDAVVSHRSAARLHLLAVVAQGPPTVSTHSQTTNAFPLVDVIRTHDLLEAHLCEIDGLPTTTVPRTIVDLASMLKAAPLTRVIDDAVAQGKTSPDDIRQTLESVARRGKRGVKRLRDVLADMGDVEVPPSVLESKALRALDNAGIDTYEIEYPIPWSPTKRFDIAFVGSRLAIELDSRRWHTRTVDFDKDRARDREAIAHGWRVLRFTWKDVHEDPDVFASQVARILSTAPDHPN